MRRTSPLLLAILVMSFTTLALATPPTKIYVDGEGKATRPMTPKVTTTFTANHESDSGSTEKEVASKLAKAEELLKGLGFSKAKTVDFSTEYVPETNDRGRPTGKGEFVTTGTVEAKQVGASSTMIGKAIRALSGIPKAEIGTEYFVGARAKANAAKEAMRAAEANALKEAQARAGQVGLKVVSITSIGSPDSYGGGGAGLESAMARSASRSDAPLVKLGKRTATFKATVKMEAAARVAPRAKAGK